MRTREVAVKAAEQGVTPIQYMLAVMRDEKADASRRDDMARAAAPFCHPRLASTAYTDNSVMTHEMWLELLDKDDDG